MHIGLIGGIGAAATVVYYQRLCAAMSARGRRLELTIVQADIHELIANNLADRREEQARLYAGLIGRLKAAGRNVRRSPRSAGISVTPRRRRSRPCRWSAPWRRSMPILPPRGCAR